MQLIDKKKIDDFIKSTTLLTGWSAFSYSLWFTNRGVFNKKLTDYKWFAKRMYELWRWRLNLKQRYWNKSKDKIRSVFETSREVWGQTLKEKYSKYLCDNVFDHCPYCWKTQLLYRKRVSWKWYTFNFSLDHFFPLDKYAFYGLSLYNLVPACVFCNSYNKNNLDPKEVVDEWGSIFHPYFWRLVERDSNYYFDWREYNNRVYFDWKSKEQLWNVSSETYRSQINRFYLNEIYSTSRDTSNDIKHILNAYIQLAETSWIFSIWSFNDLFLYLNFFSPKDKSEILKYTNWKMRYDILNEIKKVIDK